MKNLRSFLVLLALMVSINGPHQGAIVDTPEGSWWFFHFQEWSPLGRIVHLQPMHWENGWPVMGIDFDGNGIGEPVMTVEGQLLKVKGRKTKEYLWTDDFEGSSLKPEWQWNHNPNDDAWSVSENKGRLTLHALQSNDFIHARNSLTLRTIGYQGTASPTMYGQSLWTVPPRNGEELALLRSVLPTNATMP